MRTDMKEAAGVEASALEADYIEMQEIDFALGDVDAWADDFSARMDAFVSEASPASHFQNMRPQ